MQIALTKNLADAMKVKPSVMNEEINPLFSWTANWTNVWEDEGKDMLVLINNATRFTVAVYQVYRRDLRDPDYVAKIMQSAIKNTLLAMNVNPELVEEYLRLAQGVEFVLNKNRSRAAWVSKAGLECAFHAGREYQGIEEVFSDQVGTGANYRFVGSRGEENFQPYRAMFESLTALTDKPLYHYRAFELLVTLDLEVYKAVRRLIVPADIGFSQLHEVIQRVFDWGNVHLYDFAVYDQRSGELITALVPFVEDLEFHPKAALQEGHTLSEFFPEHESILYTYDMGDGWEHRIELVRVIEDYDQDSPYLLEASGQAPPEDVGGVPGFMSFREIMLDPKHPDHEELKAWAGLWKLELSARRSEPQIIRVW